MASPKSLASRNEYTVGWIAPLPIERAAAEVLLDEKHGRPLNFDRPPTGKLSYSWGSIGGHNVVITSLKAGMYGTNAAATAATSMLSSFPDIRFGLLVGTGGGIPRLDQGRDVRLGDVVISEPSGSSGGVIQYDLVKAKKGGELERKDFLNSPPEVLLYALSDLKNQHEQRPPRVPEFLKEMAARNSYMVESRPGNPGFKYQGHHNDRLFEAAFEHVQGPDCSKCPKDQEVPREPRENCDPVAHYGVIASGNTLVKDAAAREELLKHIPDDCICYEMEAAGLMNNFPCLVIRGICNYADSHKNDQWQRYAAATAAAYAKELLNVIPGAEVTKMPTVNEVMEKVAANLAVNTAVVQRVKKHALSK